MNEKKPEEKKEEREQVKLRTEPPYPWCIGSPTKEDCCKRGYCNRNPNCGE